MNRPTLQPSAWQAPFSPIDDKSAHLALVCEQIEATSERLIDIETHAGARRTYYA